jgi:phosphoglucosamine mutase
MKKLFGTDGIRGRAGSFPLDESTVHLIARSLATEYRETSGREPRFITGRDTRESGGWIEAAFHAGAKAGGAVCASAGVITTPGVAFVTREFDFDAGIVISASHNPYADNGIKIFSPAGNKIGEEIEERIERDIHAETAPGQTSSAGDVDSSRAGDFQKAYFDHLRGLFGDLDLSQMRIVIDCANGAASSIAPELFRRMGAGVTSINDDPDGRNINRECGSLHLQALSETVVAAKADLGVAFDGDADRALFVDESGSIVDGDGTLWILARFLLARGELSNRTVVATVMSNIGLEIALATADVKLLRTPVGDKYVLEELLNTDSDLGGEQSGHIILPRQSLVGDGIMTTLFVLKTLLSSGESLSALTSGFTRYPQILVNVPVREKRPFDDVPEIAAASRRLEEQLAGAGRLLLRYSGTENLARVMIEGKDQADIETQANGLADIIRAKLG